VKGGTDGRTDGQNYDSQDRAGIVASRGNKCLGVDCWYCIREYCG